MAAIGRVLVAAGFLLLLAGALLLLAGRLGVPLGRLPGDLHWRGRHTSFFAPLGTCLLLSVLLALFNHLRR